MFFNKLFNRSNEVPADIDPNSIGNMAIEKGWVTRAVLSEALRMQKKLLGEDTGPIEHSRWLQIGHILVDAGYITDEQRDELVMEQRIRKGEKISYEEMRCYEKRKLRRRINGVSERVKEAGTEARNFAALMATILGSQP